MEWVPAPLATVAAWGLTATFAWAAAAKVLRADAWPGSVAAFGFSGSSARVVVVSVPVAEVTIVALFAVGIVRPAAALTLALVAAFSAAVVRARTTRMDNRVPCGCFGGSGETDYRLLLGRNLALLLLAALILMSPRDVSLAPPTGGDLLPAVLVVVGGVVLVWTAVQTASSFHRR